MALSSACMRCMLVGCRCSDGDAGTNAEEGGIRRDNASNTRHGAATGVGTKALIVFGSSRKNELRWHVWRGLSADGHS